MEASMIKLSTITYLVVLSMLLNVSAAQAEEKDKPGACRADVEKLCKGVQPGQGRIVRCLAEHKDQLSAGCRENVARAESRHPCMKDVETLCKGVQPGEGRVAQCLKQHEAELSAECKAHHAQERDGKRK
jgi:hypothetical protein